MAKKICIFASHYFPYLGGVERYTYNLAKALIKRGDKVVIVTSNDMHLETFEKMDGIPVYRMPCFNLLDGRFPVSKFNRTFREIHQKLMHLAFDLVIVNARFYLHSVYGVYLAKKQGAKSIILDHSTGHMTIDSKFWNKLGGWFEHIITGIEKYYCKNFYGVSEKCSVWLQHFGIEAKGTIHNGVNAEKIEEILQNPVRDFREEYQITSDTRIITYTGRLLKEKGILNLITAVECMDRKKKAALFIAGDGDEMDTVREAASERIIPLGRLSFEGIVSLLRQTDIYCFPTDYPEGFPTVILEAAAVGCFVITTDKGGTRELIPDECYGMIMKDNQAGTIQDAIEQVIDKDEYRETASKLAQKRVLSKFTWDKISDKVHKL